MKQFMVTQRIDFLKQMVSNGQQKTMRNHLGADGRSCMKTSSLRQKVADWGAVEVSCQPAREGVELAKALFATATMAGKRHETHGSIQVLFDSFSQPVLAGTRPAPMSPMGIREIIFRADPYQLDIQIEAQTERNRLVVTGQVMDISHTEMVRPNIKVALSNLRGRVVQTTTNEFGEFRGELENSGDLELSFFGLSGKPVVTLLRGALKQSSGAKQ